MLIVTKNIFDMKKIMRIGFGLIIGIITLFISRFMLMEISIAYSIEMLDGFYTGYFCGIITLAAIVCFFEMCSE